MVCKTPETEPGDTTPVVRFDPEAHTHGSRVHKNRGHRDEKRGSEGSSWDHNRITMGSASP